MDPILTQMLNSGAALMLDPDPVKAQAAAQALKALYFHLGTFLFMLTVVAFLAHRRTWSPGWFWFAAVLLEITAGNCWIAYNCWDILVQGVK